MKGQVGLEEAEDRDKERIAKDTCEQGRSVHTQQQRLLQPAFTTMLGLGAEAFHCIMYFTFSVHLLLKLSLGNVLEVGNEGFTTQLEPMWLQNTNDPR